jgi:hypothetical protein
VDPVPDPLLLRKSGSARNQTRDLWVNQERKINCVINTECSLVGDVWAASIFDLHCTVSFNYYNGICTDVFMNRN